MTICRHCGNKITCLSNENWVHEVTFMTFCRFHTGDTEKYSYEKAEPNYKFIWDELCK